MQAKIDGSVLTIVSPLMFAGEELSKTGKTFVLASDVQKIGIADGRIIRVQVTATCAENSARERAPMADAWRETGTAKRSKTHKA